jgi:hypothetical protein
MIGAIPLLGFLLVVAALVMVGTYGETAAEWRNRWH